MTLFDYTETFVGETGPSFGQVTDQVVWQGIYNPGFVPTSDIYTYVMTNDLRFAYGYNDSPGLSFKLEMSDIDTISWSTVTTSFASTTAVLITPNVLVYRPYYMFYVLPSSRSAPFLLRLLVSNSNTDAAYLYDSDAMLKVRMVGNV